MESAEQSLERLRRGLEDTVAGGDLAAARDIYREVHTIYKDLSEFIDEARKQAEKRTSVAQTGATASDILALAEKLSITVGAAPEWTLGNPMIGFHAPAPQDMQMRLGKLANTLIDLEAGTDLKASPQLGADGADDGDQLTKRTRMQTEGAPS